MSGRGRAARVTLTALAVLLLCGSAGADTLIELPKTKARLELFDGWQPIRATGLVTAYRHASGAVLAVTRADVPNPEAWRRKTREAYADRVERGIAAAIPGYRRRSKKLVTAGGIPALDVEARRVDGATVLVRVLLFRTYALSLAIEVPANADPASARAIVQTFAPKAEPPPSAH